MAQTTQIIIHIRMEQGMEITTIGMGTTRTPHDDTAITQVMSLGTTHVHIHTQDHDGQHDVITHTAQGVGTMATPTVGIGSLKIKQ